MIFFKTAKSGEREKGGILIQLLKRGLFSPFVFVSCPLISQLLSGVAFLPISICGDRRGVFAAEKKPTCIIMRKTLTYGIDVRGSAHLYPRFSWLFTHAVKTLF